MSMKEKSPLLSTEEINAANESSTAEGSRSTIERSSNKGRDSTTESLLKNITQDSGTCNPPLNNVSQILTKEYSNKFWEITRTKLPGSNIPTPTHVRFAHLSDEQCLAIFWKAPKDQLSSFRVYVRLPNFDNEEIYHGYDTSCTYPFCIMKEICTEKKPLHFQIVTCNYEGLQSKPTVLTLHPRFPGGTSSSSADQPKMPNTDQPSSPSEIHPKLPSADHLKLQSEAHPSLPSEAHPKLQGEAHLKLQSEAHLKLQIEAHPKFQSEAHPKFQSTDQPKLQSEGHSSLPSEAHPRSQSEDRPKLQSKGRPKS